ncbi:uncharacterized protein LOC126563288 [Anopheles maculipalpis]|uniref:uncharacterized protein LOC126563288 n=1 Tax=Anopheles maculipalpis TaxID=1496333 RepID=UPI002158FF0A|nr:uncharacterized protein LOC126563288 [Anopheles maculipalpis]
MTRSVYHWFALASVFLLLLLQQTVGELQRNAGAKPIVDTVRGGSSTSQSVSPAGDRTSRVRAQLAGGFIDDAAVHQNGAAQRHAYNHVTGQQRTNGAGSGRKMAVHGTSGPIHTYIKTDKNANFKWGVRHFVGAKYAR